MTTKDYKVIAQVLKTARDKTVMAGQTEYQRAERALVWYSLTQAFANALAEGNHRFDRAKFLAACGCV